MYTYLHMFHLLAYAPISEKSMRKLFLQNVMMLLNPMEKGHMDFYQEVILQKVMDVTNPNGEVPYQDLF